MTHRTDMYYDGFCDTRAQTDKHCSFNKLTAWLSTQLPLCHSPSPTCTWHVRHSGHCPCWQKCVLWARPVHLHNNWHHKKQTASALKAYTFNPSPSLMLQSVRDLNVPRRPKRSKALLLSYTFKCPLKKTQSFCSCSRALYRSGKGLT
jgi:hypothetical protein